MALTDDQITSYQTKGHVRLPVAFGRTAAESMATFVWARMAELHGIRRDDPGTWNTDAPWKGLNKFKTDPIFRSIGSRIVCAAIDELLGEGCWRKPPAWGGFLIKFPDRPHQKWTLSDTYWHVDFHFTYEPGTPFGVRLFSFLSEVAPRGGATLVVSGSHHLAERFVASMTPDQRSEKFPVLRDRFSRSHPWLAELTGTSAHSPQRTQEFLEEPADIDGVSVQVEELRGEPGDVVIMHPWLLHSPSPNAGRRPRLLLARDVFSKTAQNRFERPAAAVSD